MSLLNLTKINEIVVTISILNAFNKSENELKS